MASATSESSFKANLLLALQFLSDFGDQITSALLALCVLDITKSTNKVGLVYFMTTFGYFLFTLIGGYLGDKLSRRTLLFSADMCRGLMILFLALAVAQKSMALIYGASFLQAILGALQGPVKMSAWAENIPSHLLVRYNSLSEFSIHASSVAGPLIASLFVLVNAVNIGFVIDAASFFICAIAFLVIMPQQKNELKNSSTNKNFFEGFTLIAKNKELAKYISYDAIQMMGFGTFNATFLVLAQRDLGFSKTDYSYHLSIVAALTAIGALLGATSLVDNIKPTTKLIGAAIFSSIAFLVAVQIGSFPLSSLLIGCCDFMAVLTISITRSKVQIFAKENFIKHIASVMAARAVVIKAATLTGVGIALALAEIIGLKITLMLYAIPIAVSCLPFLLWPEATLLSTDVD